MLKIIRNFLPILMLFALALACVSPGAAPSAPVLDQNAVNLAIEQTSAAAQTQTAQSLPPSIAESFTPTATKILTATSFPTFTAVVLLPPQLRVTEKTRCRAGPGNAYESVATIEAGEIVQVVGRSKDAKYWIIHNPDHPDKLCWLAGNITNVLGMAGALPVYTPPPTRRPTRTATPKPKPTRTRTPKPSITSTPGVSISSTPAASFTVSYHHLENCPATGWWVDLRVTNNGGVAFKSISMIGMDTANGAAVDSNILVNRNDCGGDVPWDEIPYGSEVIVSSPVFLEDITGHPLEIQISLCSGLGQTGRCATKTISVTP